jgi:hypothetical protein
VAVMEGLGELIALVYVALLVGVLIYWPLQLIALLVTRHNERLFALGVLGVVLAVFGLTGDTGPDGPNFPPWSWVLTAGLADVTLVWLMIRSRLA